MNLHIPTGPGGISYGTHLCTRHYLLRYPAETAHLLVCGKKSILGKR